MHPAYLVWALVWAFLAYCILSFLQFFHHRKANGHPEFPRTDRPVSVIMGILSDDEELEKYLHSACNQDYPTYEVIFVSNVKGEPGAKIGVKVAKKYDHARHVFVGRHNVKKMTGKNHALLEAIKLAKYDTVLFSDADVDFEPEWVQKLVSPIGQTLKGRTIHAVGAPVIVHPRNKLGTFFTLSSNVATYLSAFAHPEQAFPAYVTGHSMAIEKDLFEREIAKYWKVNFNDDLILAHVLWEKDYNLYYNRAAVLRPQENFSSWKRMYAKMVRWAITVRKFQHPKMRREITKGSFLNAHVTAGIPLALIFLGFGFLLPGLLIAIMAYTQSIIFRQIVSRRMGEELGAMVLLTPVSQLFFGTIFIHYYTWGHRFTWGGCEYYVKSNFSMDEEGPEAGSY